MKADLKKSFQTYIPDTKDLHEFNYDNWFFELSKVEYMFFHQCISLLESDCEQLLELLINRKKRQNIIKKIELTGTKKNTKRLPTEQVHQFFEQVSINELALELALLAKLMPYEVEQNVGVLYVGQQRDNTIVPFTVDDVQNGRLHFTAEGDKFEVSIQACIYFVLANEMVHQADMPRIVNCKSLVGEATFAVSYSKALLQQHLNYFFIQPDDNCVTSYLIAMIMFTKTKRFIRDAIEIESVKEAQYDEELMLMLIELELKHEAILNSAYIHSIQKGIKLEAKKEQQLLQKVTDAEQKYDKLKYKYEEEVAAKKELKQQLQQLEKQNPTQSGQSEQQQQQLTEAREQLKELRETKKELERSQRLLTKDFEGKIEQLEIDKRRLVSETSNLQQQLINEKRSKVQQEELSFEQWLEKGRAFLATLTTAQEQQLENFLTIAHDFFEQRKADKPKQSLTTNKVGYVKVKDGQHTVHLANGDVVVMKNIPVAIYPANDQFVELTKDDEFVQLLREFHYDGPANHLIAHYAIVVDRNGEPFIKIDGKLQSVKYKDNVRILDGQVISVNSQFELVYYYQPREISLDDIYPSVLTKGHEPYYVELTLANGYVLRSLKEERRFVALQDTLALHSFIVLHNEQVTLYDATGRMLKTSMHYRHRTLASVSEIDSDVYVLKQNEEYVMLQHIPLTAQLELGDMVWIDEHHHFISKVEIDEEFVETETVEQKLLNNNRFKVTKQAKESVAKDERLLIIGNIRLSERYKTYFGQLGYEVDVVDGTGPYEKIRQACSKHSLIIYCTACTKHKHSDKLADDFNKQYILCDSTSPQVIKLTLMKHVAS